MSSMTCTLFPKTLENHGNHAHKERPASFYAIHMDSFVWTKNSKFYWILVTQLYNKVKNLKPA